MTPEEQIDAILLSVCESTGADMADWIRQNISDPYPPASEPNTPPHRRTGDLIQSLTHEVIQQNGNTTLYIVAYMPYAIFLEYGTSRMICRPFLQPALDYWAPVFVQRLQEAFGGGPNPAASSAQVSIPPIAA